MVGQEETNLPDDFYPETKISSTPEVEKLPDEFYQSDTYGYRPYEDFETEEEKEIKSKQDDFSLDQQSRHYQDLNKDAVELLKNEKQTYESIKNNKDIQEAAVRMAEDYLGRENIRPEDALEEVLEHFNKFDVNELTAAYDFGYVSGLVGDIERSQEQGLDRKYQQKIQALNDYRLLFTAKNALPYFWQEGGRSAFTAIGDVTEGIIKSPSTWLGMLLPVVGKVAAQGSTQASKFAITKLLQQVGKREIATAVAIEGTAGALQDVAAQKTQIAADLKKDYSLLQTGAVATLSAVAPAALIPLTAKGQFIATMEKNTGDIVALNQASVERQLKEGVDNADAVLEAKIPEKGEKIVDKKTGKERTATEDDIADAIETQEIKAKLEGKVKPLDEEAVKRGIFIKDQIAERGNIDETFEISIRPEKYKPVLAALVDITKLAREGKTAQQIVKLDEPETRISEVVHEALRGLTKGKSATDAEKSLNKNFQPILEKYNLTMDDFADVFLADASEAARILQQRGELKKMMTYMGEAANYNYFGFSKEVTDSLKKVGAAGGDVDKNTRDFASGGIAREIDAARLAFMTSQPATTLRNVAGGLVRLPIDAATRVIDTTLQRITGVERLTPNSDAWALFNGFLNAKEYKAIQEIFKGNFQEQFDRIFRPLLDVADASKTQTKLVPLAKMSRLVNVANTVSDNWFKRVAFVGSLKRQLNDLATKIKPKTQAEAEKYFDNFLKGKMWEDGTTKITDKKQYYKLLQVDDTPDAWKFIFREKDFNLANITSQGNFHKVFGQSKEGRDAIQKATEDALYFTYQKAPDGSTNTGKLAQTFIQAVHAVPFVGTSFAPFPRFMVNAMRFTYEYSPTFLLLNKNARSEFAALVGNKSAREINEGYSNLAKGLLGTAFILGATKFRMSEHAGDKWYLGKNEDGSTFDMRPFFPLAPYLYFGDLVARKLRGEPITAEDNSSLVRDTLQTLTGMNLFKTGFGLYSFETLFADMERGDHDKMSMALANFAANFVETFTIPATVPQDFYNSYFAPDDARILKNMEGPNAISVFLNKSFKRLPGNDVLYSQFEKTIAPDTFLGNLLGDYEKPVPLTTPFRATDPIRRPASVTRQFMGVLIRDRATAVEEEFTRLRISTNSLNRKTKNAEYDKIQNLISEAYAAGPLYEFISSDAYNNIKPTELDMGDGTTKYYSKSTKQKIAIEYLIENQYKPEKQSIMEGLQNDADGADIIGKYKFERGGIKEIFKDLALQKYHKEINVPKDDRGYNYDILQKMAKELSKSELILD